VAGCVPDSRPTGGQGGGEDHMLAERIYLIGIVLCFVVLLALIQFASLH
jgi:hypothetical protein